MKSYEKRFFDYGNDTLIPGADKFIEQLQKKGIPF